MGGATGAGRGPCLLVFVGFVVATVALPVLVAAALGSTSGCDAGRWIALRLLAMLWVYLAAEAAGIVRCSSSGGRGRRQRPARATRWTYAVQGAWATVLFGAS